MSNSKPYLEKYTGRSSRHECPACNDPHSFALYLDGDTAQVIHKSVGRCNHESSCGYHYAPKDYFADNPTEKEQRVFIPQRQLPKPSPKEIGTIPFSFIEKSASYQSDFIYFLCSIFDIHSLESPTIERLMNDYALGATKGKDIIYWQMDIEGRVRTGKVMKYNSNTGKRVKDAGGVNWIHALLKKQGQLSEEYNLVQCLFGEHLLKRYPDKTVAIVESEKSALIASGVYPEYVWLATGGKSQLSIDKLKVLQGRTVVMFPDVDGFDYWQEKAKELQSIGCKVVVSDVLEKNASDDDRANKIDIADWLIRQLQFEAMVIPSDEETEAERLINVMVDKNPAVGTLIDTFNLELIA